MDESGLLNSHERCVVYGGIFFVNEIGMKQFRKQYAMLIETMRCGYCKKRDECDHDCPEIKHVNTLHKKNNLKRIRKYISKGELFFVSIDTTRIYPSIMEKHASRGRYKEYAQKLCVKQVCKSLIEQERIDPNQDVEILLMFDQDSSATDGYYKIEESIKVEFTHGLNKHDYGVSFGPIFRGDVQVVRQFCDSKKIELIQVADFVAGSVRRGILDKDDTFIEYVKERLYLP